MEYGWPIGTDQRSFDGTIPNPYDLLFPMIGGSQPPPKTPIAIISGTGEATDLARTFTGSIRTKAH